MFTTHFLVMNPRSSLPLAHIRLIDTLAVGASQRVRPHISTLRTEVGSEAPPPPGATSGLSDGGMELSDPYSAHRVIIGSTRVARRAGSHWAGHAGDQTPHYQSHAALQEKRRERLVFRTARSKGVHPTKLVFHRTFPRYETLQADLIRARVERKDGLGRVLHFHSFRKTFQTLGVLHGVNQRSAQEILGHSDANLTAKAYTDVPALALHDEIGKLPWLGNDSPIHSQDGSKHAQNRVRELIAGLLELSQIVSNQPVEKFGLVDVTGLEPVTSSV